MNAEVDALVRWLKLSKPSGHSGDEESGQHDDDCELCVWEAAEAAAEALAARPAAPVGEAERLLSRGQARAIHIMTNVAHARNGEVLFACDGPDCAVCDDLTLLKLPRALAALASPAPQPADEGDNIKTGPQPTACGGAAAMPISGPGTPGVTEGAKLDDGPRVASEGVTAGETAFLLRRFLWLNHGCPVGVLYGDDGEMQCNNPGKHASIDFKREPLTSVVEVVVACLKLASPAPQPAAPAPCPSCAHLHVKPAYCDRCEGSGLFWPAAAPAPVVTFFARCGSCGQKPCRCEDMPIEAAPAPVEPPPALDDTRCAVCGWPLDPRGEFCVRGNCSQRPLPERCYDPERAQREYQGYWKTTKAPLSGGGILSRDELPPAPAPRPSTATGRAKLIENAKE